MKSLKYVKDKMFTVFNGPELLSHGHYGSPIGAEGG